MPQKRKEKSIFPMSQKRVKKLLITQRFKAPGNTLSLDICRIVAKSANAQQSARKKVFSTRFLGSRWESSGLWLAAKKSKA